MSPPQGQAVAEVRESRDGDVPQVLRQHRKAGTLSQRDWDRFIRARRAGRVGPSGRPVSDRTIEYDLKFLLVVLHWAARSRDEEGRLLLESNPLRG